MATDAQPPLPCCPRGSPDSNPNNNAVRSRVSLSTILLSAIRVGRPPLAHSVAKHFLLSRRVRTLISDSVPDFARLVLGLCVTAAPSTSPLVSSS